MNINYSRNYSGLNTREGIPIYHDDVIIATIEGKTQAHTVEFMDGEWIWGDYRLSEVVANGNPSVVGIKQKQLIKTLDNYHQDIRCWSLQRRLHKADPMKQMVKLTEEIGELANGLNKGNEQVIVDSIGYVFVALSILCQQLSFDLSFCIATAYNEIKDRKGKMINGIFVKEQDMMKV